MKLSGAGQELHGDYVVAHRTCLSVEVSLSFVIACVTTRRDDGHPARAGSGPRRPEQGYLR